MFPGGCFFAAVGAEFDTHPGPSTTGSLQFMRVGGGADGRGRRGAAAGELPPTPDPEQLIYEVDALLLMAHAAYAMYGDPALLERARVGLARLLGPRPD